MELKFCPVCGHKIDTYYESEHKEPYVHHNPFIGMMIYSAYSSDKKTICQTADFLHFAFSEGEHRLVKLGCEVNSMSDENESATLEPEPFNVPDSFGDPNDDLPF